MARRFKGFHDCCMVQHVNQTQRWPAGARRDHTMMRHLLLLVLLLSTVLGAAEDTLERQGVRVVVRQVPGAIEAVFTPEADHHLYGLTLPAGGPGAATRLELAPGTGLSATGPVTADQVATVKDGLSVFPTGPVTLRLPVQGDQSATAPVVVGYMACTETSCRIPVPKATLQAPGLTAAPQGWQYPRTRAEVDALLTAAGPRPVLLDFTGPSCLNCQVMAKTVFRQPQVVAALGHLTPIEVDTDPPHDELAAWQQERFHSQNRPLYIRLENGRETRWSEVFAPTDRARLEAFLAFLAGGPGSDTTASEEPLGRFALLALLGGLITLLMPCTYPMVPFTLTFFAKQAAAGRRLLPLALAYGAGIMGCFIGLGLLITAVLGSQIATVAGHPLTNLIIAGLFIVFGLSLLGVWFLNLPSSWLGGSRAGYVGALLMGLTFALTAFTCTAPFAGAVLSAGVATGSWGAAVGGMALYSAAIAVPFVGLAMAPGLLARLPRAGAWMNELKVVGGLIELAAALKFLVICDVAWGWGLVTRTPVLALWSATAGLIAAYLLGWIRLHDDTRLEGMGAGRLLLALAFLATAIAAGAGVAGADLGLVEGFFPVLHRP